jgi:hypothetical protein
MFLSEGHNEESREWISLATGGLVGLTFVLLANVFQELIPFTDFFAVINIIFFVCVLFSPCLLVYGILGSDRRERFDVLVLISYLTFAPLIGLMIAYLARGDNYYSGLVVIPNELSWVVVAVIAILLLIPLVNLFSSLPIAMWLGSLVYYKGYESSYLFKALIGSPLFVLPLFVFLGYEICRVMRAHQEEGYVFDKASGELTPHRLPRGRTPLKKILAITSLFLIASSALVTGFATWNELEEVKGIDISDFEVSYEGYYLRASFSLVDAKDETFVANGIAQLYFFDCDGYLVYKEDFDFFKKDFVYYEYCKKWIFVRRIPKERFYLAIPKDISIGNLMILNRLGYPISGCAILRILVNNGQNALATTSPVEVYSKNGTKVILNLHYGQNVKVATCSVDFYTKYDDRMIRRLYYQSETKELQAELDKQWPFKVRIEDYLEIGNYCWAIVGRTGGEIIFYPGKIYNWYFLQSKDAGCKWDISWRGDNYPLFKAEFLSEKEIRITTPYAIFMTRDGGETWE